MIQITKASPLAARSRVLGALFAGALIGSSVAGQSVFIPSDTPTLGVCNITPFGDLRTSTRWVNQKYQCLATGPQLGNRARGTITDLGFAACSTGVGSIYFDSIEVVLAQTGASTLLKNFSKNLVSNVKTVLKATRHDWPVVGGEWNRLGLDVPYSYDAGAHGPNLVVQITVTGCHRTGGVAAGFHRGGTVRVSSVDWTAAAGPGKAGDVDMGALKFEVGFGVGGLGSYGSGCAGSRGLAPTTQMIGDPRPGGNLLMFVSQCLSGASSLQVFGGRRLEPRLDLGMIGAAGCSLYVSTDVFLGATADVTGQYFLSLPIPNNQALVGHIFYTQGFPLDPSANAWGRAASSYGRILIGR